MSPAAPDDVIQNGSAKSHEVAAGTAFEIDDSDVLRLLERPRAINVERNRSFDERSYSELSITVSPHLVYRNHDNGFRLIDHLANASPSGKRSGFNSPRSTIYFESRPIVAEAWESLRRSLVYFRGQPVGTIAALDHSVEELNYDQVFVRDFFPSALAFLMNGEHDVVRNFLLKTLRL